MSRVTTLLLAAAGLAGLASAGGDQPLCDRNGQTTAIPNWDLESSAKVSKDLASLSNPGQDTKGWHHAPVSRCTVMACLIAAGEYKEQDLWYSDDLAKFDRSPFDVPWVYRHEFPLSPQKDRYFSLITHGITSAGDIWVNGKQVTNKTLQAGAYGGHIYDITGAVKDKNAILVQAHPTHYWYDLAVGFGDWNPYSPDNGTGVWRDVEIKQTGPASLNGPISVGIDLPLPAGESDATVTVRGEVRNLSPSQIKVRAASSIKSPQGGDCGSASGQDITLSPGETKKLEFKHTVSQPEVWWPATWGSQPLYSASITLNTGRNDVSDTSSANFGIRTVTSEISKYNDTMFSINGHPFQVVGAGYNADQFLRWDGHRFEALARQILDLGQNTVRLEGKLEQPELYAIADRLGLMVMAGWECCDKWESWAYNDELALNPPPVWDDREYGIGANSMAHEAGWLQPHPSVLTFLIGSDYSPDERASALYTAALKNAGWQTPVLGAASFRTPAVVPSGLKMNGPYDWVPPNYWTDVDLSPSELTESRFGAAWGFGSELGSGVGTPELPSLRRFLSSSDLDDLWISPTKGLYHMSNADSQFHDRSIYNAALGARYGNATSLEEYVLKAQVMDYEATRSEFEGYTSRWSSERPATGVIYWMLNAAWPALHWQLVDVYGHAWGSYYGAKSGSKIENAAYDYVSKKVWLINRSLNTGGSRTVDIEVIGLDGKRISAQTLDADTKPNAAQELDTVGGLDKIDSVVFLRLVLKDGDTTLSRNVYWLSPTLDELDWEKSEWWYTPTTKYADLTALNTLSPASVSLTKSEAQNGLTVTLENSSDQPAFFLSLALVDEKGEDVPNVAWSDNYVTLWPREKLELEVKSGNRDARVRVKGWNVKEAIA